MAGSIIGDVAGGVVGGLFGSEGDRRAADQAFGAANAAQSFIRPQFQPLNSVFGNTLPSGRFAANQIGLDTQGRLFQAQKLFSNQLLGFNKGAFADRFFDAIDRLESRREAQGLANLESRLFNRSGVNTGTQRQIADFQADIEDARLDRVIKAELAADERSRGLLGDFLRANQGLRGFNQDIQNQQNLGFIGAQALTPQSTFNPGLANAGLFQAGNTQSFFDSLGSGIGGAVNAGVSGLLNPLSAGFGQPGGGFTNAGGLGLSARSLFG